MRVLFVLCGDSITRRVFCKQSPLINSHTERPPVLFSLQIHRLLVDDIEDAVADGVVARNELSCRDLAHCFYDGRN